MVITEYFSFLRCPWPGMKSLRQPFHEPCLQRLLSLWVSPFPSGCTYPCWSVLGDSGVRWTVAKYKHPPGRTFSSCWAGGWSWTGLVLNSWGTGVSCTYLHGSCEAMCHELLKGLSFEWEICAWPKAGWGLLGNLQETYFALFWPKEEAWALQKDDVLYRDHLEDLAGVIALL